MGFIEESFRLFEDMEQEYNSADTSLNQVSSLLKKYNFEPDSFIVDYGGGAYDKGKEYVESTYEGCRLEVMDKFNRSEVHNNRVRRMCEETPPDYITCANVLNVIKEDEVIVNDVLANIRELAGDNTTIIITVYEKSGDGKGAATSKGYQRCQKLRDYLPLVSQMLRVSKVGNGMIICQK